MSETTNPFEEIENQLGEQSDEAQPEAAAVDPAPAPEQPKAEASAPEGSDEDQETVEPTEREVIAQRLQDIDAARLTLQRAKKEIDIQLGELGNERAEIKQAEVRLRGGARPQAELLREQKKWEEPYRQRRAEILSQRVDVVRKPRGPAPILPSQD